MNDLAARDAICSYRRTRQRRVVLIGFVTALCAAAFLADILTGPSQLTTADTLHALFGTGDVAHTSRYIVWELRMPTSLMALAVGAALALAGTEMQIILDNPLAEPFTLGVSSCSALGAALAVVLGLSFPGIPTAWIVPANAFLFALASLAAIYLLARLRGAGPGTLVLFGIALGFTAGALLSLLQFVASPDALQQLVFWGMGSLSRADDRNTPFVFLILAVCVPFSLRASWQLTMLRLGEERARGFGIDTDRLRLASLARISLLAATAVAFTGVVGFVGLVGPHIARMIVGEDHRFLLPASMSVGALVMLAASIISKIIVPGVLIPIGIVTALVGLPVFFLLVLRRQGGRE